MAFHSNHPGRRGAEGRRILDRLKRHADLTAQYLDEGMTREEASAKAYQEITGRDAMLRERAKTGGEG